MHILCPLVQLAQLVCTLSAKITRWPPFRLRDAANVGPTWVQPPVGFSRSLLAWPDRLKGDLKQTMSSLASFLPLGCV
ncbi:unnamed protein product [Protopolystoma xenopodis]|uniref:Secreted protein n=1 Tax=Protopolystoma xenopodis TaxID=117903 RepID=A0A448WYI4_9PLAT|nr:unnamed protein product [Protopolystoma xenopodis]